MNLRRVYPLIVVSIFLFSVSPFFSEARGESWQIYRNHEFGIQFLSLSVPKEHRSDSADFLKVIWHIGFMNDGTNGTIEATRPKDDSLRGVSAFQLASAFRQGMEQSTKSRVLSQKDMYSNGMDTVEFRVATTTKKGEKWHGIMRMLVIGDTVYSVMITSPNKEKLGNQDSTKFLGSLKPISN